jgi:hypothetical protein
MKRKAEVVIDHVSNDKNVKDDDIRAKLNELHYGFACSNEVEARFLVMYCSSVSFHDNNKSCAEFDLPQIRAPCSTTASILAGM